MTEDRDPTSRPTSREDITYEDTKEQTAEFQALLEKYDNDWEKAAEAQRRGERVEPERSGDSAMPQ